MGRNVIVGRSQIISVPYRDLVLQMQYCCYSIFGGTYYLTITSVYIELVGYKLNMRHCLHIFNDLLANSIAFVYMFDDHRCSKFDIPSP
jgi:hypothetical protein